MESLPYRYVVLRHEGVEEPHFDLMFETASDASLATWRAGAWPLESGASLTRLRDHRRVYLDYEGAILGGRGSVDRVAEGTCSTALRDDEMDVRLDTGLAFTFVREAAERWRCVIVPAGGE